VTELRLRPVSVKAAIPFVGRVHRRLSKVQGAMWAISVRVGPDVIGVALVGHPARLLMEDEASLSVLRVAVLEGACSRAAKAMGAENLVTYTHLDEHGASLKAANWIDGGLTDGGEHNRPSRQRALAIDADQKRRWWAPWSKRASAAQP
jgi:hypothetical protein